MQKGYSLLLDSGTILAITIFFIVELLILMIFYIQGRLTESAGLVRSHLGAVRPAAFLFLFGVDVSKAFLPLYMQQIYEPLLGLSREIVIALPISAELLSTALGFFVAGAWIDKRGWHEPLVFGLFLGVIGQIYSWLALDPVNLILARTLVGLGYGFIAMACQGYVLKFADESNKAQGLSGLGAGIIAGSICGGAAGAMLAERIGFSSVFLCGVVPIVCVFFYFLIFLRPAIGLSGTKKQEERPQPTNPRQIFQFIGNKHVLMLLLCINFPIAIAIVGLLDYFVPVYLNRMGISESNIGRILMLYGICLIYLAPLISRSVDKSERKQDYIIVQGLLGGLTFVVFYFLGGLPAIILAVIILGLSDSLNDASLSYMLNLKISRAIGQSKALGLFNTIIRGGQLLGPLVFGGLIATANIEYSVAVFGFLLVLLSIIYVLFSLLAKSK
ncbi:MAG: MFS transporter [Desulfohalobiaceae bacterium]|nr:MFS transporter [Desulfohalobiaceae bacterium]